MNPPADSSTPPGRRRAIIAGAAIVAAGSVLFAVGVVAELRGGGPSLFGLPPLAVATAGFVGTLAGALWLRRHVGK